MRHTALITASILALSLAPAAQAQSWGVHVQLGSTDGYRNGYRYSYPDTRSRGPDLAAGA